MLLVVLLVVLAFNGGLTRKGTPSGRPLRVEAIMPAHKVILLMHTQTLTHVYRYICTHTGTNQFYNTHNLGPDLTSSNTWDIETDVGWNWC